MHAIVRTGGKQYRVAKGDVIRVEKLDTEEGKTFKFDDILMLSDGSKATLGADALKGASVTATVLGQDRNDTVLIFKKKRRHNYRRKNGHRQQVTVLKITDIAGAK